jgi:mRNA interferase MazF
MGAPAVGDVVLVAFPYDDFTRFKKRPAVVVGAAAPNNLIFCQITADAVTSTKRYDENKRTFVLFEHDFRAGSLGQQCYVRLDKLFTADQAIADRTIGSLHASTTSAIKQRIRMVFL